MEMSSAKLSGRMNMNQSFLEVGELSNLAKTNFFKQLLENKSQSVESNKFVDYVKETMIMLNTRISKYNPNNFSG